MRTAIMVCAALGLVGATMAQADVLNMASGLTSLETVHVSNPGNVDDTHGDGYGGVDYDFKIGKYEVTAGQYCEFLDAVAVTDTYELYNTEMDSSLYGCQITSHDAHPQLQYGINR